MARTTLTEEVLTGEAPTLPMAANAADVNWVTPSAFADGVAIIRNNGRKLLLVKNNHASATGTVTITSRPVRGRTVDQGPFTLQAGDIAIFGPFKSGEYNQTGADSGKVFAVGSTADILFAVVPLP